MQAARCFHHAGRTTAVVALVGRAPAGRARRGNTRQRQLDTSPAKAAYLKSP
jgi:hypothetical protein